MKSKYFLVITFIVVLFLGGCKSKDSISAVQSDSQEQSQTNIKNNHDKKKKHAKHLKREIKSSESYGNNYTDQHDKQNAGSKHEDVPETSASKQDKSSYSKANKVMNLEEIEEGNYSSFLGEWREVATSANHHDSTGDKWGPVNPEDRLTVTPSKVMDRQMTLEGRVLSDKYHSHEGIFQMENGALNLDGPVGAADVSFWFYPKGIPFVTWIDNSDIPSAIRTDTERIALRVSGNSYVQVYERVTN